MEQPLALCWPLTLSYPTKEQKRLVIFFSLLPSSSRTSPAFITPRQRGEAAGKARDGYPHISKASGRRRFHGAGPGCPFSNYSKHNQSFYRTVPRFCHGSTSVSDKTSLGPLEAFSSVKMVLVWLRIFSCRKRPCSLFPFLV